jgi:hypothetical protein
MFVVNGDLRRIHEYLCSLYTPEVREWAEPAGYAVIVAFLIVQGLRYGWAGGKLAGRSAWRLLAGVASYVVPRGDPLMRTILQSLASESATWNRSEAAILGPGDVWCKLALQDRQVRGVRDLSVDKCNVLDDLTAEECARITRAAARAVARIEGAARANRRALATMAAKRGGAA